MDNISWKTPGSDAVGLLKKEIVGFFRFFVWTRVANTTICGCGCCYQNDKQRPGFLLAKACGLGLQRV
jgi:hypothetical protein